MVITTRASARRGGRNQSRTTSSPQTGSPSQPDIQTPLNTSQTSAHPVCPPQPPLPSVEALLTNPILPSDIFQFIPAPCVHSTILLLIRVVRAAALASSPEQTHRALLHFHMIPTVVLHKALRGERGWRSSLGQMHALRRRIPRATRGEWGSLWQEAKEAHKAREEWYRRHYPNTATRSSRTRRAARALRLASQAQYTRAMRTLTNDPIADLNDPETHTALENLHPAPNQPIIPLNPVDLPPAPEVQEPAVLRAVRRLNPNSAGGPDRMPPRLFHLLVTSQVSPEAGITGLSSLTLLVRRLARGHIPEQSIPLLAAATLLPLRPKPNKIRPIAIGQALRRLVTKVLLPAALADSKDFLQPLQLANGTPSAIDAIVHDARMLMRRHGSNSNFIMVSIDARNAFKSCSRQRMLNLLIERTPSLARFINAMYARTVSHLIIPSGSAKIIQSREGTQQGDPASMLLVSITIQPLLRAISRRCKLSLNRWYADDGLLIGPISEVKKALQIIRDEGPAYQFHLNVGKAKAFWPTVEATRIAQLTDELPVDVVDEGGLDLLGAPVGSNTFMSERINAKLDLCNTSLDLIDDIPDARIKFHLHRMCGSACRVQHMFRLVPPEFADPYAIRFDQDQMKAYERFNNVPLSTAV